MIKRVLSPRATSELYIVGATAQALQLTEGPSASIYHHNHLSLTALLSEA